MHYSVSMKCCSVVKNVVIVIRISASRPGLSSLIFITSSVTTPAPFKLQTKIVNITPEILSEIFLLCLFLSLKTYLNPGGNVERTQKENEIVLKFAEAER